MSRCPRSIASCKSRRVTSSHRHTRVFIASIPSGRRCVRSTSFVFAARLASFEDGDALERRKKRLDALPDPGGQDLAGWILETRQIVEVVVIELFGERLPGVIEALEIDEPAGARVDRS